MAMLTVQFHYIDVERKKNTKPGILIPLCAIPIVASALKKIKPCKNP